MARAPVALLPGLFIRKRRRMGGGVRRLSMPPGVHRGKLGARSGQRTRRGGGTQRRSLSRRLGRDRTGGSIGGGTDQRPVGRGGLASSEELGEAPLRLRCLLHDIEERRLLQPPRHPVSVSHAACCSRSRPLAAPTDQLSATGTQALEGRSGNDAMLRFGQPGRHVATGAGEFGAARGPPRRSVELRWRPAPPRARSLCDHRFGGSEPTTRVAVAPPGGRPGGGTARVTRDRRFRRRWSTCRGGGKRDALAGDLRALPRRQSKEPVQ